MIIYFADRFMNILGQASTELPEGLTIIDDLKTEDVETGVASFEFTIPYDFTTRAMLEECTKVGNYVLRSCDGENEFYTIIDSEKDSKKQEILIYAEDAGLDLLNEVVGAYSAGQAYKISGYINKYAAGSGFEIGINEVPNLTRKLSWDGESTVTERLASIATQFDNCEISYSFKIDGLNVTKKYINVYKKRGKDDGVQLRLNKEVDRIVTKKSIANLATSLQCTGGTPDNADNPITLKGYKYDDGDFYVDSGGVLRSRKAVKEWGRLVGNSFSHITKQYSYDTTSQKTLCAHAVTELKKISDIELNFEIDINDFPENVRIGDRVNIIDDEGELYISSRLLKLESSEVEQTKKATFGEYLIKSSGISQKVADLAQKFAQNSLSAARALKVANAAKETADGAQEKADSALSDAATAQTAADAAQKAADTATQSAQAATQKADLAKEAVDTVVESVTSLETTVTKAQEAADNAYKAAETADQKAQEAAQAAAGASKDAADAKTAATTAQGTAESAIAKADTAVGTAGTAKEQAETASATAAAAKADAAQAQKDIDAFGSELETVKTTMSADYARKTDLTEATTSLQSQITQNAGQIATAVKQITVIDETANNAAEQAANAQSTAAKAQEQAASATADATAAQAAADTAKAAADAAQANADTAKAAADTAQNVASKAESDLAAAKEDLASVQGRVDATEEDIAAAQEKVTAAQEAADKAKADALAANTAASDAQIKANTAVTNAEAAQSTANDAASKAAAAQKLADEAKGNAAAAQKAAEDAQATAANAQTTANTAKENAATAQSAADSAAAQASAAQSAADAAKDTASKAESDLAAAKQNLEDVTNRVGATEEDVKNAQSAVTAAQEAADKAKADALAAQTKADEAKGDATAAQNAADSAKMAADAAKKAADDAKAAADKAQADANALAKRVTRAETSIEQNSEKIELAATKEEVTTTLGGYYTKTETDAKINVSSEQINLSVSKNYATKQEVDNIQVGGRNLILGTAEPLEKTTTSDSTNVNVVMGNFSQYFFDERKEGKVITLSFDWETTGTSGTITPQFYGTPWSGFSESKITVSSTNQSGRYEFTKKLKANEVDDTATYPSLCFRIDRIDGTTTFRNIKCEFGNKATDHSIAPEDVSADIDKGAGNAVKPLADAYAELKVSVDDTKASIQNLVTDKDGKSLLAQTSNGWTFNMSPVLEDIQEAAKAANEAGDNANNAQNTANIANELAKKIETKTAYIDINTDDKNNPYMLLGSTESPFQVRISNQKISFIDQGTEVAYINNRRIYITDATVKNEIQIGEPTETSPGNWMFKKRENGNLGLEWID